MSSNKHDNSYLWSLSQAELRLLYDKMRTDLALFGEVVCPHLVRDKTKFQLHQDIARVHLDKPRFQVLISFRGSAKTTWASTISSLHDLAYDRERVTGLIKKSWDTALGDLENIKLEVKDNDAFRLFFGEFTFHVDRTDRISVTHNKTGWWSYTFSAGIEQAVRGKIKRGWRVTKLLLDDIEDEKNTNTPELRERIKKRIAAVYIPLMDVKVGHILAIGTIAHFDGWFCNRYDNWLIAKREGKIAELQFPVIYYQIEQNGVPMWPERFPLSEIDRIKRAYAELGRLDMFYQEHYNLPFDPSKADFKREQILYYEGVFRLDENYGPVLDLSAMRDYRGMTIEHPEHVHSNEGVLTLPLRVIAAYDLASGEGLDFTGVNYLGVDFHGYRYELLSTRRDTTFDKFKRDIFADNDTFRPHLILLEEEAHGRVMKYWLAEEMRKLNKFLPLRPDKWPAKIDKNTKLRQALQPIYASGTVCHRRDQTEAEEELFTFPKQRHDDILDAKYMCHKWASKPSEPFVDTTVTVKKRKREKRQLARYDWMTGARKETTAL
jgi:hypothetical protein